MHALRRGSVVTTLVIAVVASLLTAGSPALTATPARAPAPAASGPPIAVAPVAGALVRDFDPPAEPWGAGHRGVSLAASAGDPVVAAMDGVVSFAGEVARRGWVTVDHGGGLQTTYGVLEPRAVAAGDRVGVGDPLGLLADDAGHVHWGARLHGEYIHPLSLLGSWRVRLVPVE